MQESFVHMCCIGYSRLQSCAWASCAFPALLRAIASSYICSEPCSGCHWDNTRTRRIWAGAPRAPRACMPANRGREVRVQGRCQAVVHVLRWRVLCRAKVHRLQSSCQATQCTALRCLAAGVASHARQLRDSEQSRVPVSAAVCLCWPVTVHRAVCTGLQRLQTQHHALWSVMQAGIASDSSNRLCHRVQGACLGHAARGQDTYERVVVAIRRPHCPVQAVCQRLHRSAGL